MKPNPLKAKKPQFDPAGVLPIDKPAGLTSHDVVARIRRTFGYKKVGHAGTLDPMATGVLVLLVGKATRSQDRFLNDDKVYTGTIRLGQATSTYDRQGEVTDAFEGEIDFTREQVDAAMEGFRGEIEQMPPMVSAIKHKGKPLYKYARKGIEIERKPRRVTIHRFELVSFEGTDLEFEVECTKGTYIRSIAHDLGNQLGCFGHLHALRRTRSGPIGEDDLHDLDSILKSRKEEVLYLLKLVSEVHPEPPKPSTSSG